MCAQVSDSAGLLCVYTCTPRATTTHNSTSQFAVERFLGLYHDAENSPRGGRFLLLYEVKPFWLRSLSGLQIKSKSRNTHTRTDGQSTDISMSFLECVYTRKKEKKESKKMVLNEDLQAWLKQVPTVWE